MRTDCQFWSILLGGLVLGGTGEALFAQEKGIHEFPKLSAERDWPWWRGPSRNGIATSAAPVKFSDAGSPLWKTPVPGRGHSSPIVVGDRIFLTTADEKKQIQSVLAFDKK